MSTQNIFYLGITTVVLRFHGNIFDVQVGETAGKSLSLLL